MNADSLNERGGADIILDYYRTPKVNSNAKPPSLKKEGMGVSSFIVIQLAISNYAYTPSRNAR